MLLGNLLTLRQHKFPVKIVVFNNGAFGFVELEMKAACFLEFGTELDNPNFAELAQAMGIEGIQVEHPNDLESAVRRTLEHSGPVVLDVVVNRQEFGYAAEDQLRAGTRIYDVDAESRFERARQRNHRTGENQSPAVINRSTLKWCWKSKILSHSRVKGREYSFTKDSYN